MAKKIVKLDRKTGKLVTQKVHDKRDASGRYARSLWTQKGRRARYNKWKRKKLTQSHRVLRGATVAGGGATLIMGFVGAPILLTVGVMTVTVILGCFAWNTRHWL